MKLKTTISFDPAPGPIVGYGAVVVVNQNKLPQIDLPADATSFVIEVEEGSQVVVLLSSKNAAGVYSPAIPMNFLAIDSVPPLRPTNARVTAVETVNIAAPRQPVQLNVTDEAIAFNISVSGHPEIKDGAIGTIVGIDPDHRQTVHAMFPASALKPGVKNTGPSAEYKFSTLEVSQPGAYKVSVLTPDQETITLDDYVKIQHDLLNALSEVT